MATGATGATGAATLVAAATGDTTLGAAATVDATLTMLVVVGLYVGAIEGLTVDVACLRVEEAAGVNPADQVYCPVKKSSESPQWEGHS